MNEKDIYSQEKIDEMRKRLYSRGAHFEGEKRHELTDEKVDVSREWKSTKAPEKQTSDLRQSIETEKVPDINLKETKPEKRKRGYRSIILIGSFLIFIIVATLSSLFLYFGGNQISNENIQISINGPKTIGGGEVMDLQVGVTNQNTVGISTATLILKYPEGTRSIGDSPRVVYEERFPLNGLAPGEQKTVPVKVAVFGEENSEKNINATIEYRIENSNGMFYKESDPLSFQITSAPIVLRVDSVKKVASGQLVDVELTVVSNASSPLYNVLVTASYPNGFAFEGASPEPVYGQNVWQIGELLPEQSYKIKLNGILSGLTEETFRINFEAGQPSAENRYIVASTLAEASSEFVIERPFVDVGVAIAGSGQNPTIIAEGENTTVDINIKNTLDETIYDMVVEVIPKGNALNVESIRDGNGFYDSNSGSVRWEVSNNGSFSQVLPGDVRNLNFSISPNAVRTTASFELTVNVYARRVAEASAAETLIGTTKAEAKYSSSISLGSQVGRNTASFSDSGSVPPKVGEKTTYTVTLVAEAGANDMSNVVVNTSLPIYVNWSGNYEGDGEVVYNSVSKQIEWKVGDISLGRKKEIDFQVDLIPSLSQVGRPATLLNGQKLKANDRFTGQLLQADANAVTTELSTEMGYEPENGNIRQ